MYKVNGFVAVCTFLIVAGCSSDKGTNPDSSTGPGLTATPSGMLWPKGYTDSRIWAPRFYAFDKISIVENGTIYVAHNDTLISRVDPQSGTVTTVASFSGQQQRRLVTGGPSDSFMVQVDTVIRRYAPDGTYAVWGTCRKGLLPWHYTPSTRKLLLNGFSNVAELSDDGSIRTIVSGMSDIYDVAAFDSTIYVFEMKPGIVWRIRPDLSKDTLLKISPDNTDLGFDRNGKLYCNSVETGFASVDLTTRVYTSLPGPSPGVALSPADFVIDHSGIVVFAAWAEPIMSRVDYTARTGSFIVGREWPNSGPSILGSDDAVYMALNGTGTIPTRIVRCDLGGTVTTVRDSLQGNINDFAFDNSGRLIFGLTSETTRSLNILDRTTGTVTTVPGSSQYELASFAVHPVTGNLVASKLRGDTAAVIDMMEIALPGGSVTEHSVKVCSAPIGLQVRISPDGTIYGCGVEKSTFLLTNVGRWVFRVDLVNDTATVVFQNNRVNGSCPITQMSIDHQGYIHFLVGPEMELYQITPQGVGSLLAKNITLDASAIFRTRTGSFVLNTPIGVFLVEQS